MLKEHQGFKILSEAEVPVPPYGVANSPEGAYEHAKKIGNFR